jgi:mortality factor 4-like protein 1
MLESLQVNDKCLAFHGPLLYEAKVMKTRDPGSDTALTKQGTEEVDPEELPNDAEDERVYFIHYKGWKSSWDEWVTSARLKELTLENLKLQKELKNSALASTSTVSANGSGRKTIDVSKSVNSRNNRRSEADLDNEQDFNKRPEILIIIPDSLKSLLVDDWEMVTKDHLLLKLPVKTTIEDILNNYRRSIGKKSTVEAEILDEFLAGLKMYFNRSIGNLLLYRFERQQYLDLQNNPQLKDKDPSRIYGAEHLMRLIVTMPSLIAQTTMDQQSAGTLKDQIERLLRFIEREKKVLFLKNYENVSPAYEALAKSV